MLKSIIFSLCFFTLACHKLSLSPSKNSRLSPQAKDDATTDGPAQLQGQDVQTIKVTSLAGQALAGAQILIGPKQGEPFANNLLTADAEGLLPIPKEWTTRTSVTVHHPGFLRVTYLNIDPQSLQFQLRPLENTQQIELSGTTQGFGNLEKNNIVDFGLVLPSLSKQDLFTFSLDKIISKESDTIEVAGMEAKIPSNVTLPRQKESYIVPITLQKERYRLYFNDFGPRQIYALHGRFPFQETVDKITEKVPFHTLVNDFEFQSGSLRSVNIQGNTQLNLPVNERVFSLAHRISPPSDLTNAHTMISVALFEENNFLYPTDLHKVENARSFPLKNDPRAQQKVLSLLVATEEFNSNNQSPHRGSAEMVTAKAPHAPEFLDLLSPLTLTERGWSLQSPEQRSSIQPLTTYALLSKIEGSGSRKRLVRQWEVFAASWVDELSLPEWPGESQQALVLESDETMEDNNLSESPTTTKANTQRWEISYLGSNLPQPLQSNGLGPGVVDYITHVSFIFWEY